jgi:hypothetical protein
MKSIYKLLDAASKEIRLITLHAGDTDCAIDCALDHYPLTSTSAYQALSYTWGDSQDR